MTEESMVTRVGTYIRDDGTAWDCEKNGLLLMPLDRGERYRREEREIFGESPSNIIIILWGGQRFPHTQTMDGPHPTIPEDIRVCGFGNTWY